MFALRFWRTVQSLRDSILDPLLHSWVFNLCPIVRLRDWLY